MFIQAKDRGAENKPIYINAAQVAFVETGHDSMSTVYFTALAESDRPMSRHVAHSAADVVAALEKALTAGVKGPVIVGAGNG